MPERDAPPINDVAATEAQDRASITAWMEANIGGNIRRIEKLRRWRPMWRVDFTQDGADAIVLVRGMRPWESIPYSLENEMKLMQGLDAHGIHVPHVYGMMPSPTAFVLARAEGPAERRGGQEWGRTGSTR